MNNWPTQAQVLGRNSVYGDPVGRAGGPSAKWESTNLVMVVPKWTMWMGDIRITRFRMHKHCAPAMQRVLDALYLEANGRTGTLAEWGMTKFGGSFNYRVMRGLNSLSMHAFGCAVDFDPVNNGLSDRTPRFAEFPMVLAAFEKEGARWGGDWNGNGSSADERRCDGMHWQFTK